MLDPSDDEAPKSLTASSAGVPAVQSNGVSLPSPSPVAPPSPRPGGLDAVGMVSLKVPRVCVLCDTCYVACVAHKSVSKQ